MNQLVERSFAVLACIFTGLIGISEVGGNTSIHLNKLSLNAKQNNKTLAKWTEKH